VCGAVTGQLVGDEHPRHVQQPPSAAYGRTGLRTWRHGGSDQDVQHVAVLVDSQPQVLPLSFDREEHLVEVPLVTSAGLSTA
jgi:hypothetical protein